MSALFHHRGFDEPAPPDGSGPGPVGVTVALKLGGEVDVRGLRMLSLLLASPDREACTCDLTEPLGLTQPTVTHHLGTLAKAGIVVPHRRVGNFTDYQVVTGALSGLAEVLASPNCG